MERPCESAAVDELGDQLGEAFLVVPAHLATQANLRPHDLPTICTSIAATSLAPDFEKRA
jgi:hypothetical protein